MDDTPRRRTVLTAIAGGLVAATAGCLGGSDEEIERETYGEWFRGANNFEGTVDQTGQAEVTVDVGAGSGLSFAPAAVRVSTGTTVNWEWTGLGGGHNVVEEDGVFESEIRLEEGETFSHTFAEPGVYRYACTPHQSQGMLGAVEVVE